MSDITKKIFSIEHTEETPSSAEPSTSDIIRPISDKTAGSAQKAVTDEAPDFVTREPIRPRVTPPSPLIDDVSPSKAAGWLILGFGILYLIGAGLYFGLPLVSETPSLIPIAGLVLILLLPVIVLFLLWRALRHLSSASQQNHRLTKAAEILVTPDREALDRTENLANGIRTQIDKVNSGLSETIEALKSVQLGVTRESQALDAAGLALSNRSDEIGQNLTLQRQTLESMSGTFDTRMSSLSTQITDTGQMFDDICTAAETKLLNANEALQKACVTVDETVTSGATNLGENIISLEDASRTLQETRDAITSDLTGTAEAMLANDSSLAENSGKLQTLNAQTQSQISDLQTTIGHGYEMLADLQAASETRATAIASHYENLTKQLRRSEDGTLAMQGKSARMVESNLAQMRHDFSQMETDLKALQTKLARLKEESRYIPEAETKQARLNLKPLDSDFPPVEPTRPIVEAEPFKVADTPLNLGMDMEIESPDEPLINYEPEVVRRPGEATVSSKGKGFGRRTDKEEKSSWRWRDMLGTLERRDDTSGAAPRLPSTEIGAIPTQKINGATLLSSIKLSPAAIVDEGTVVDATQARINIGEAGLSSVVFQKLPEAVEHLKDRLNGDAALKEDLWNFTKDFSTMIGNTPPTAPALRAALGSPEGRAYLLCAAAFRPELGA